MTDILAKICADKRVHVARRKAEVSPQAMMDRAFAANSGDPPRGFARKLSDVVNSGHFGLIAEIKRASPSVGEIRSNFDPVSLAVAYRDGGATCLSVLTDEPYFLGHDSFLKMARDTVALPVLRKDFIIDPYQVHESRALGADCVLLIMAALSDEEALALEEIASSLNMDALVEVHNEGELQRAMKTKSKLIGINNRDLTTLRVDLATTERLAGMVPKDRILVTESGLRTTADLERMQRVGANAFLVGESLMREADVAAATRNLLGCHSPNVAA